jgi:hypothetical protein
MDRIVIKQSLVEMVFITLLSINMILLPGCNNRILRVTDSPEKILKQNQSENKQYIKLHMKNMDVYVFDYWKLDTTNNVINGKGRLFNLNRNPVDSGEYNINLKDIALAELNQITGLGASTALAAISVITGIFTIVCIANPKACFGSCPTFYVNTGSEYILQAEGFSSSISPSLEESDIDALFVARPSYQNFELQVRNEAYETQAIRYANLLALPRTSNGRVFKSNNNLFYQSNNILEVSQAVGVEGDISEKLCSFDGNERFSPADSNNLAAKEEIDISFINVNKGNKGLILASRQTLMTTFLFYQTLAYMGTSAGYWFAELERNPEVTRHILDNPRKIMGGIEVFIQNDSGEYVKIDELIEHGPIATDIKIVPLSYVNENSSLNIKLRMTKGLWRIDYVALADILQEVKPIIIQPETSFPEYSNGSKVISLLIHPDSVLITLPGDRYFLNYKLPDKYDDYELFLESKGYYLEWIRGEWLKEESPSKVQEMIFNPKKYFKDLAPQFKKIEAEMEETFWSSKYVLP